jgi:hypothetical protein
MTDYAPILARLEANDTSHFREDRAAIMALLGYEVADHARLGQACRPIINGEAAGAWQSLPRMDSADSFELWVIGKVKGATIDDIGRENDGRWYCSYSDDSHGNDYGYARRMGTAMWAAFVALNGKVERAE